VASQQIRKLKRVVGLMTDVACFLKKQMEKTLKALVGVEKKKQGLASTSLAPSLQLCTSQGQATTWVFASTSS
jgi:hypothetical protein